MTQFAYLPYPKSQQLSASEKKSRCTQKQLGNISSTVRKRVNKRSGDYCERCGKHKLACWTLENAHVDGRRVIKHKTTEYDLIRLCGPSTQSGTCHHWVHTTKEGKEWMKARQQQMLSQVTK